jgi:hypothetical protein
MPDNAVLPAFLATLAAIRNLRRDPSKHPENRNSSHRTFQLLVRLQLRQLTGPKEAGDVGGRERRIVRAGWSAVNNLFDWTTNS